jgi:hypothetical protein
MERLASITSISEGILAIIGIIAAAWIGMKKLYKMAKNVEELVQNSLDNKARLDRIEKQVIANGGSSLRDAVNRIETRVAVLEHIKLTLPGNVAPTNEDAR